jgi:MscS family membrane protein
VVNSPWLDAHLPAPLLEAGPFGVLAWQWIVLPALLLAALLLGRWFSRRARHYLGRLAARTAARWDDQVLDRAGGPLTLAWALAFIMLSLPLLGLPEPVQMFCQRVGRAGFLVALFWACERAIDVAQRIAVESAWALQRPASRSLLPLAARIGKVVLAGIAVVVLLAELGYSVTTLLAGLGIGGLAVALAAQKTVENLFGALSIGADQPFREGDFIRVDDLVGTVEAIGLRSTRIRTLDRTLVSIPNGKLAEMRLESFAARDRIRLACTLGLVYGTSVAQMREVLAKLEAVLLDHPQIWPDRTVVRFKEFGASSLDIEIMAWFATTDFAEFQLIRQEIFLRFMEAVEAAGTAFAFPTRTLHLVNGESPSQ